ncbi:MAG TPA: sensor histidine kinase [Streptosporangiaceae bacterium]|nr:sensor histidine kinase [Streptosporangiaceae bacterium]
MTGIVADWHGGWAAWGRRMPAVLATRHASAVAGLLLGLAAVTEAVARGVPADLSMVGVLTAAVLALCTTVPLAFLGPPAAAVSVCLASLLSLTLTRTLTAAGLIATLIVLFRLGRDGWSPGGTQRNIGQLLALVLAVPFLIVALTESLSPGSEQWVLAVLLAGLAPAAALAGIAQRARAQAHVHIAARRVTADSLVEHTARGERARIARELHDVVAHHISMIAVQAETARLATPGMPAAGAQRLQEIGDTARAGLTEMRRLLGVLREDARAADPVPGNADRRPQPGLQQLNELLDEAREASGAGLRLIVSGPPATLDPGVELAAYRIVQEGLTNARRHAPGAAVDVELRFTGAALRLRIRDNGPGPSGASAADGGHGLTGMRERAAAAGGELRTGAAPGGGFLIEATLPARAETTI